MMSSRINRRGDMDLSQLSARQLGNMIKTGRAGSELSIRAIRELKQRKLDLVNEARELLNLPPVTIQQRDIVSSTSEYPSWSKIFKRLPMWLWYVIIFAIGFLLTLLPIYIVINSISLSLTLVTILLLLVIIIIGSIIIGSIIIRSIGSSSKERDTLNSGKREFTHTIRREDDKDYVLMRFSIIYNAGMVLGAWLWALWNVFIA